MSTRTDVHRPSAINPADYEFIAVECARADDLGAVMMIAEERARIRAHMAATGGTYSRHAHGGNCHVCGNANAIYTALFYHAATNSYIRMGEDCADKCYMGDPGSFRRIRDAAEAAQFARAGKLKAHGLLTEWGMPQAWTIYSAQWTAAEGSEERTVRDIVGKLVRYGDISEAQRGFLRQLIDRIPQREQIAAARQAERDAAQPAPAGRLKVAVEVLSVKAQESAYGTRFVMTVRALAGGWMAWGSAPDGIERGSKVTLSATFTPSQDDPKFAFFKRPRIV